MALQGTLDTFALPDVLRLLATTGKTGCVRVTGPRGTGAVWVDGGAVGTIEIPHAPHATDAVDGLFELLRFDEGSFTFETDGTPPAAQTTTDVEVLISGAETLLAEWREIESVVPSMDAFVTLRRELVAPTVTISREQWVHTVAVGSGATVREVGDTLALPELPVSRAVRELVELGLVDISAAAPADRVTSATDPEPAVESVAESPVAEEPGVEEPVAEEPVVEEPVIGADATPTAALAAALAGDDEPLPDAKPIRARRPRTTQPAPVPSGPETFVPLDLPGQGPAAAYDTPVIEELEPEEPAPAAPEDDELARQLATLSPRAAEAVRAAAEATSDEERDAALDAATEGDETTSRGALLKFLSSVKS